MVPHQVGDALPDGAAPPQALADRDRHLGADGGMAVEGDPAVVLLRGAGGLGHVVEEGAERERLGDARRELLEEQHGMHEHVALGVEVGRLGDAGHGGHLGQDGGEEPRVGQQLEARPRAALGQDARDLVPDALGRDVGDGRRRGRDRGARDGLDREAEAGGEAHGAQHAQAVLGDARAGVADRADDAGAQVRQPADEVDHLAAEGVEEEPVDGEVAALGVRTRRAEVDARRAAAVHVGVVRAEGRHLERHPVLDHQDDAELRADRHGAPEERLHGLRGRAGGDVEVERLAPEELIAHAAAGEVRLVPRVAKSLHDPSGEFPPVGHAA